MIGFDGIGFHAVGELITDMTPAIEYLPVSRHTGVSASLYFKKRADYPADVSMLWDDGSEILWDDSTPIEWGD